MAINSGAKRDSVRISQAVYRVCVSHALMTEREEVMGLLLGDSLEEGVLGIWASLTLLRSDKRPDRVEISPEQLVAAAEAAEQISNEIGRTTRVIGWYHSHPHITVLPSHVDLQTQMQYQGMDSLFVGLIFAVFNADANAGTMRHEVMGFRAHDAGSRRPLQRVELKVSVEPLCNLLSDVEEERVLKSEICGGAVGERGMVSTVKQSFTEVFERHQEVIGQLAEKGDNLARAFAAGEHWQRVSSLCAEELVALGQHLEDEVHNARALADVIREANEWRGSQPDHMRWGVAEVETATGTDVKDQETDLDEPEEESGGIAVEVESAAEEVTHLEPSNAASSSNDRGHALQATGVQVDQGTSNSSEHTPNRVRQEQERIQREIDDLSRDPAFPEPWADLCQKSGTNRFSWQTTGSKSKFFLEFVATDAGGNRSVRTNLANGAHWEPMHEVFNGEEQEGDKFCVIVYHGGSLYHLDLGNAEATSFVVVDRYNDQTFKKMAMKLIEGYPEKTCQSGLMAWCTPNARKEKKPVAEEMFNEANIGSITFFPEQEEYVAAPAKDSARSCRHPDAALLPQGQAPAQKFSVARFGDMAEVVAQQYIIGTPYEELAGSHPVIKSDDDLKPDKCLLENDAVAASLKRPPENDTGAQNSKAARQ